MTEERIATDGIEGAVEPDDGRPPGSLVGALIGILSGAVALGIAHLVSGFTGEGSSPVLAVGAASIDATPEWLKSFAIRTFGAHDKTVLLAGIAVVLTLVAAGLGIASLRRRWIGIGGLIAFGALGAVASVTRPANGTGAAIPSIVGTAAGIGAYIMLRHACGLESRAVEPAPALGVEAPRGYDRRRFLWTGVAAAGVAVAGGEVGRILIRRAGASASREAVEIPNLPDAASPVPSGAQLDVVGVSPFITPNDRFYRVDTALFVPAVAADTWMLRVHGMVERELTLDYEQLRARPLIERDVTLTCVSNEVGGRYIGNARWIGTPLKDLLEEAGVAPEATQLVSRSADGFTAGSPTALAMDGRDAMLAIAMNGEPLPLEHGFPVRLVIPGLYGYVSATKWLVDLELTTFEAYDAYWIKRGWSQQGPIKTGSRIDTPKSRSKVTAGDVAVAGVAWAQHRGIEAVEVQVDGGPWLPAELGEQVTVDTWRQWVYRWRAEAGSHTLAVRATDGTGAVQIATPSPPFPNGATGYHTVTVEVS